MWCKAGRLRDALFLCGAQVFCAHILEEIGVYAVFCNLYCGLSSGVRGDGHMDKRNFCRGDGFVFSGLRLC